MRNFKFLLGLGSFLLALSSLNTFSNWKQYSAHAESNTTYTKALAKEGLIETNVQDAYIYFTLDEHDYAESDSHTYAPGLSNYRYSDYNFGSHIQFSKDKENFISLSDITSGIDYFCNNGRFRVGISRNEKGYDFVNYSYVRILEGCEFPSYIYCRDGGALTKYVQESTTLSKISNFNKVSDSCTKVAYSEEHIFTGEGLHFTAPATGWNNTNCPEVGYKQAILQFGTFGVDYFSNSHRADATEQALESTEIGKNLTFNGIPAYKLRQMFPLTSISYAHGYNYLYIKYPVEILKITKDYAVPTINIPNGTQFMDQYLAETNIVLLGDSWTASNDKGLSIECPDDLRMLTLFDMPFTYPNDAIRLFAGLRKDGCALQFNFNTGDNEPTASGAVTNFVLYGITISIMQYQSVAALYGTDGGLAQVYYGMHINPNTDYNLEIVIEIGVKTKVKVAINHAIVINAELDSINADANDVWTVNPQGTWTIDYFKELNLYSPIISFDGSSYYDFLEGEPVYNFASLVNAFDIYGTDSTEYRVSYDYDVGAVTDGKYNAGTWKLRITLNVLGYDPVVKVITINVHGRTSMAKIYYDDNEAVLVPVGSKLIAPKNPDTYQDDDFDYVFEGWYFEGAKWNFDTDVVQGDMHLSSRFTKTDRHFLVTVKFEGINRPTETYSVLKNTVFPLALFEVEGATFVAFNGDDQVNCLTVTSDVTLIIKYAVTYVYHEKVNPTCDHEGNIEYWTSPVYPGVYFADYLGVEVLDDIKLSKTPHSIIHIDAVESTCTEDGNIECYYCTSCRRFYSDLNGENEIDNYKTSKKGHVLTHHEGYAATCEHDGEKEYWTCANEPGVYYTDENCEDTLDSIVIYATGHEYGEAIYTWSENANGYECRASVTCSHCSDEISENVTALKTVASASTCSSEGQIVYTAVFSNSRFTSQNKVVSTPLLEHSYVHYDEVTATKEKVGVKEHYECSSCHKYFVEENGSYVETTYDQLLLIYKAKGCGGSIEALSLLTLVSFGGASIFLYKKSRKEDR